MQSIPKINLEFFKDHPTKYMLTSVKSKCVRTNSSWSLMFDNKFSEVIASRIEVSSIEKCRVHCKWNNKPIYGTECPNGKRFQCLCYDIDAWNGSGDYDGNEMLPINCEGQNCGTSLTQAMLTPRAPKWYYGWVLLCRSVRKHNFEYGIKKPRSSLIKTGNNF